MANEDESILTARAEVTAIASEQVGRRIYTVRGQNVMLDSDLAELYGVETRTLNQAVKRNTRRFPEDFMFQLTAEEAAALISQSVISNDGRGGRRKPTYAFTEQGVAMLSGVLRSERAVQVNIAIMRAFVSLRGVLTHDGDLARRILTLEQKYDEQFAVIFKAIRLLIEAPPAPERRMGFRAGMRRRHDDCVGTKLDRGAELVAAARPARAACAAGQRRRVL